MSARASTSLIAASATRASASTAAKNAAHVFGSAGSTAAAQPSMTGLKPLEGRDHLVQVLANVAPRSRTFVGLAALRRIREHELVAGLDGLDALL